MAFSLGGKGELDGVARFMFRPLQPREDPSHTPGVNRTEASSRQVGSQNPEDSLVWKLAQCGA
jgi:hypothetical protein